MHLKPRKAWPGLGLADYDSIDRDENGQAYDIKAN